MNETAGGESPSSPDFLEPDVALARIEALTTTARTTWLVLIGFLAFIGLTVLSVRDADFFSITATTDLPIVNIAIPTTTFFWTAALLAAILHTYFHVFLLKLWDALAEAPPQIGKLKLGDRVFPWLVNDWALSFRRDDATSKRPIDWLAQQVIKLVIWWLTPIVLAGFWLRSMPAHNAWLTLTIGGALVVTLFATLRCKRWAKRRLRSVHDSQEPATRRHRLMQWLRHTSHALGVVSFWLVIVPGIGVVSVAGAGGHRLPSIIEATLQAYVPQAWEPVADFLSERVWPIAADIPIARANLVAAEIAIEPHDWRDPEIARRRFHVQWCRDAGIPEHACEKPGPRDQELTRERWCKKVEIEIENGACAARFRQIDEAFEAEWQIERQAFINNIRGPDLRNRDLRNALASGAFLVGVDLNIARLEGADLSWARLERAHLLGAGLQGADLSRARLEGAFLHRAQLEGADLRRARLEGADLSWAQLQSAEWAGATVGPSPAHLANFAGAKDLTQAQLAQVIGDAYTILPLDAETGEQLYVWSCWAEPPPALDSLLAVYPDFMRDDLRAKWLCAEGEKPRKVFKPAEAVLPAAG